MKEKEFRLALDRITHRDIPHTNLWDDIRAKAVEHSPSTPSTRLSNSSRTLIPVLRLARVNRLVLALVLLSVVSMTGYAIYRLQQPRNGLDGISTSSLRTQINQSQTIDGVTVTLNWVYADTEQLVMSYSATVLDEAGVPQPIQYKGNDIVYRLKNAEGEWIIPVWSTVWVHRLEREIITAAEWEMANPFPQSFTLELVFNQRPLPGYKAGAGQLFLGGYTIPPESTSEPGQMAIPSDGVGPFRFNFNVTPASGVVLKVNQTVVDQGYSVTLQEIRIAPSKAHISYCIRHDADGEWTPALMDLSNETYSSSDITMQSRASEYSECVDASVGLFTPELPEQLTFQIEAFDRTDLTAEDWQRIEERVIEKGGESVYANGYLLSWHEIGDQAKMELGYRIFGDWTITVDVEQALANP